MIKKFVFILCFFLFLATTAQAINLEAGLSPVRTKDTFSWNIASDLAGGTPNILSELKWDYETLALGAHATLRTDEIQSKTALFGFPSTVSLFANLTGRYGLVYEGTFQDSDYAGDNRTGEFSRAVGRIDEDSSVYNISGEAGITFSASLSPRDKLGISPSVGVSRSAQKFAINNANQVYSGGVGYLGPISGLDSSYENIWEGPFIGLELRYERTTDAGRPYLAFWTKGTYQWVDYSGEGVWNLRADFAQTPSFRHNAEGKGIDWRIGTDFSFDEQGYFTFEYLHRKKVADKDGTDVTYFSNGTIQVTRLNEAKWTEDSFMLTYSYKF